MEYSATLLKKMDAVRITEKFVKREFVLTDNAQSYPQTILFQLTNDRCKELDAVNEGDEVKVDFSLGGREWKNPQGEVKFFNSLNAFKVTLIKKGEGVPAQQQSSSKAAPQEQEPVLVPTPDDDLPF